MGRGGGIFVLLYISKFATQLQCKSAINSEFCVEIKFIQEEGLISFPDLLV